MTQEVLRTTGGVAACGFCNNGGHCKIVGGGQMPKDGVCHQFGQHVAYVIAVTAQDWGLRRNAA